MLPTVDSIGESRRGQHPLRWPSIRACLLVGAMVLLAGCASTEKSAWHPPHTGDALADGRSAVLSAPPKDRVVWQCRTAATAMRRGLFPEARQLLDEAITVMGAVRADDKDARKSRRLFHEEARKTFIGEPYERCMAYFYRGILYWIDGERDNARACFRNVEFLDGDAEDKTYAGDYILADYLDALASAKLGSDSADALKRASKSAKSRPLPPIDPGVNLLLFAELGQGPAKFPGGEYGEQLRFRDGSSLAQSVRVTLGSKVVIVPAWDNLTYQATTRGGRVMDHILANKAVFKDATDTAGNVGILSGAILAGNRDTREVGLGLLAAGVISKIVSAATVPAADVRCWENLPNLLGFAAVRVEPGVHEGTVEFVDGAGRSVGGVPVRFQVNVPADGREAVVFLTDRKE